MSQDSADEFCLYLWRSLQAPGIVYLARSAASAQAVYSGLAEEGYIVKAVHAGSGAEFEIRDGALLPVLDHPARCAER
ncbi:MAG TPA: hypothetical protein VEV17_13600 [Bryobacteraceae bacterium]|nr:hypothetical protein [Bryobacteraceae bacterium]